MMILLLVIVLVVRFIVFFASFGRLNGLSFINKGLSIMRIILLFISCYLFAIIIVFITTTIVTCLSTLITLVTIS